MKIYKKVNRIFIESLLEVIDYFNYLLEESF